MSALLFALTAALLFAALAEIGIFPPMVAAGIFAGFMLLFGVLDFADVLSDYRREKRRNRDAFLREVIAAHKRQREAREATERA